VPWWTQELTIKRKRLNDLRRLSKNTYCRAEGDPQIYHEEKSRYQTAIKKEKLKS